MKPMYKKLALWGLLISCVLMVSGLVRSKFFAHSGKWNKADSQNGPPSAMGCGGSPEVTKKPSDRPQVVKVNNKGQSNTDDKKIKTTPSVTIWEPLPEGVKGPFQMLTQDKMVAQRSLNAVNHLVLLERKEGKWSVTKENRLYGSIFSILPAAQERPHLLLSSHQQTTTLWSLALESFQPRSIRTFDTGAPRGVSSYTNTQAFVASDKNVWVFHKQTIYQAPIEPVVAGILRLFCDKGQTCFALTIDGRLLKLHPQWSLSNLQSKKSRVMIPKLVKEIVPPSVAANMPSYESGKLRNYVALSNGSGAAVVYMNQVLWGCKWTKLSNHRLPEDAGSVSGMFWFKGRLWLGFELAESKAYLASIDREGNLQTDFKIELPSSTSKIERHGLYLFATQGKRVLFHNINQGTFRRQFSQSKVCD